MPNDWDWDYVHDKLQAALVIRVDFLEEKLKKVLINDLGFTNEEAKTLITFFGEECSSLEDEVANGLADDKMDEWLQIKRIREQIKGE